MKKGRGAAAVLTNRQANVLGAVGEKCWNCGHYAALDRRHRGRGARQSQDGA